MVMKLGVIAQGVVFVITRLVFAVASMDITVLNASSKRSWVKGYLAAKI
jgi:hypothetical protein